jgi:hypothetical protein
MAVAISRRSFWAADCLPFPAMMLSLESINSGQLKPKAVILPAITRDLGVRVTPVILGVGNELSGLPMLDVLRHPLRKRSSPFGASKWRCFRRVRCALACRTEPSMVNDNHSARFGQDSKIF